MLVGKKQEECHVPKLSVDVWETKHDKNGQFSEFFTGKKPMENTDTMTYLGVEISADGKNMKTILQKRNKQIGKKHPAYGRQRISRPMRIVAPIQ